MACSKAATHFPPLSTFVLPNSTAPPYCRSYSPFPTRFKTLNPAFLASEMDNFFGELKVENNLRTGFLHAGHLVKGAAESGRLRVNLPPHTAQAPSHNSYS